MGMTRNETIAHTTLEKIAERVADADVVRFMCDFDTVRPGEEAYRTVHYGRVYSGDTFELLTVSTDARTGNWEVSVMDADMRYRTAYENREGSVERHMDFEMRQQQARVVAVELPESLLAVLDASRAAGLSDFDYSADIAPTLEAAAPAPRM